MQDTGYKSANGILSRKKPTKKSPQLTKHPDSCDSYSKVKTCIQYKITLIRHFFVMAGTYHVILDESHYKELLMHHVSPPPASSSSECSLIRMGFPQHTIASLSDQDAKPSFSMAQLENNSEPCLTLDGYFCPQCRAKYCELPVECKVCGLTLVSAPHLARSYHHLFPLDAFQEVPLEEYQGERCCQGCQAEIKDQNVYICKTCKNAFCVECDVFVHDSLHCCPGCIHEHPAPVSV
uniref:C2H2-type domain-containing protein n=1 Tax=Pavo cristatus TaxID=9049 RepID=A0A8C9F016_PAVCR